MSDLKENHVMQHDATPAHTAEMFEWFRRNRGSVSPRTGKIAFAEVGGLDVYNITAPFPSAGHMVIAGRVERRDSENSQAIFFHEKDGSWRPVPNAPRFELQDPFFTFIGGELIFGGVETYFDGERRSWRTIFYRGQDIFSLSLFFVGPPGMKDIRLCELADGRIGIFTRPQGQIGGRGTIGYAEAERLDALSIERIESAVLLDGMLDPRCWGGVNEAHLLPTGEIGVLSHVACFEHDDPNAQRCYYVTVFNFDPKRRTYSNFRIIASRDQFETGPAKRPDLVNVVFSSGLLFDDGKARLYVGVSDTEAHWIKIDNPFVSQILTLDVSFQQAVHQR